MCVDGLEKTKGDPNVDSEDVQVAAEHAVEDGAKDSSSSKDEYLCWMRILSSQPEGSGVLVMDFVNMLVQRTPMQSLVSCIETHEYLARVLRG